MTERSIQLTDIKWIDPTIAKALSDAGVTVQILAGMNGDELLAQYPFVGTINAWLLTSEAEYIMEQVETGLWDPGKQADLEMNLEDLAVLEQEAAAIRIHPRMEWPPRPRPVTGQSVRVKRIQVQAAKERKRQRELERLYQQAQADKSEEE